MRQFDDVNVVYLHGIVTCLSSPQMIVMEHMKYGPLLHFIRVRMTINQLQQVDVTGPSTSIFSRRTLC